MKNLLRFSLIFLVSFSAACSGDDETPTDPPVDNPPTITLTAPNGGMAYAPNSTVDITWTATDAEGAVTVALSYTADGGMSGTIAAAEAGASYSWTTPDEVLYGVKVKAVATDTEGQTAEDESDAIFAVVASSERGYVTSDVCAHCHADVDDKVSNMSGHPYKLNKVEGGVAPSYPFSVVPAPPAGYTWDDVSYVIGGYGWKARFIGLDGYIITAGGQNQYNLATSGWVDYHKDEQKPYDCGPCHMTGWQDFTENGGVNQDGLPGILGTWEEPGINCEECHGAGSLHVATQTAGDITIDETPELCGKCHQRGGMLVNPEASGGFIRHHEQFNEWNQSAHSGNGVDCAACHDNHTGVNYGMAGIVAECTSCHTGVTNNHLVPIAECATCHMAQAGKSAVAKHAYEGDVKTHLFAINSGPETKDFMFFNDGEKTRSKAFVTLDFVCYQCHKDENGVGGNNSMKTMAELSAKAVGIHN